MTATVSGDDQRGDDPPSAAQRALFFALVKDLGMTEDERRDLHQWEYGVEHFSALNREQVEALIDALRWRLEHPSHGVTTGAIERLSREPLDLSALECVERITRGEPLTAQRIDRTANGGTTSPAHAPAQERKERLPWAHDKPAD
jgi:hypothetical protein